MIHIDGVIATSRGDGSVDGVVSMPNTDANTIVDGVVRVKEY